MAKRRKIKNRIIISGAIICVFALLITAAIGILSVSAAPEDPVFPEAENGTLISISSSNDLLKYAYEYYYGGHNPNDILDLSLTEGGASYFDLTSTEIQYDGGNFVTDHTFEGIGTSSRPFNGTVKMNETAQVPIVADRALFGYITTNVTVVDASNSLQELEFVRRNNADAPLFADTVVYQDSANDAEWKVKISADTNETNSFQNENDYTACSFAGVIGSIDAGCVVDIEFTHDSVVNSGVAEVSSAGNVGTICGTLGAGAELTVKCTSTSPYTVTSTGGHAGGIVGVMGDSSKLIFNESYVSAADVTSSSGSAGGIAGSAENAEIEFNNSSTATVSTSVTGSVCSGGVYGHYKSTSGNGTGANASTRTFELNTFISDGLTVSSTSTDNNSHTGGFIGYLEAENSITVTETGASISDSSFTKKVRLSGGKNCGGIIGAYSNTDLENVLYFNNVEASVTPTSGTHIGGILGRVLDDDFGNTYKAAYVNFNDVYAKNTSGTNVSGGIAASVGHNGSFADFTGTVKFDGKCENGLIKYQNNGVVRLAGTTDLSGATYSSAQLIGNRKDAERGTGLVYALGSGSDYNEQTGNGWTFKRGQGNVDDIGDWGEVLRNITESTFFTVDMTEHTVTVAAAVNPMTNATDFIKTALNIQHNVSGQPAEGALRFTSGTSNTSASLLAADLSISANIDLKNTGINAMTRDDGSNNAYTGTFSGNDHKISLAIGETYGIGYDGNTKTEANIGKNNWGTIFGHKYLGLFAKSSNAEFDNLTVDGFISLWASNNNTTYNVGGVTAEAAATSGNTFTVDNVTTEQDIQLYTSATSTTIRCGGAIGVINSDSAGTFDIKNSTFANAITEQRTSSNDTFNSQIGGGIGYDASTSAHTVDFSGITLSGTYNDNVSGSSKFKGVHYGGLLCGVAAKNGNISRKINLKNITVTNDVSITTKTDGTDERATGAGAFLGSEWFDVDVKIGTTTTDGVTIGSSSGSTTPTITVPSGSSANTGIGALVYKATGHMLVNNVKVNKAKVNSSVSSSFGFIVNDALNGNSSALYLELISDGYNIAALEFSNGSTDVYDEVAAYSKVKDTNTDDNGQAVISIRTAGGAPVTMTGSACNTYQNQTTYGKNTVKVNPNTRYYYNLDLIRAKASPSDAEKMLLWSLNKYAHSTIRTNYFNNSYSNRISGNCDMVGLSYYPVDASGMTIAAGTKIKFYNNEIETGEAGTGNSDGSVRSTYIANRSQHYLMHEAIFRNYTGNLTVNGLTVQGNVSNDTGKSGFIVRNMLGNTENLDKVTIKNIVLDGAVVNGTGYAPLLINDIGKNVSLDMSSVSTKSGSYDTLISGGGYAASSLIGDVGSDTATNITLKFSDMVLDSRTTALLSNTSLTGAYGTGRTIFSRATFLNNFAYANGGYAEYNYEHDEDYGSKTHHVTYAKEVSESVEYAGRENQYFNDDTYFTDPTTGSNTTGEYDFSSGFLPHVYNYDGQQITDNGQPAYNYFHEIRVNLKSAAMESGCGHYNDPYVIKKGDVLSTVASIISGNLLETHKIILPDDLANTTIAVHDIDMWCDFVNDSGAALKDRTYQYNGTNFVEIDGNGNPVSGGKTIDPDRVREYLAGAYYSIEADIELPADFVGLGALKAGTSDAGYENKYAFRGVIIGHNHTLYNLSTIENPLIRSANGCVVKDLTVSVGKSGSEVTIQISAVNKLLFR